MLSTEKTSAATGPVLSQLTPLLDGTIGVPLDLGVASVGNPSSAFVFSPAILEPARASGPHLAVSPAATPYRRPAAPVVMPTAALAGHPFVALPRTRAVSLATSVIFSRAPTSALGPLLPPLRSQAGLHLIVTAVEPRPVSRTGRQERRHVGQPSAGLYGELGCVRGEAGLQREPGVEHLPGRRR